VAAVDYFLKIDGIKGESTDDKHKGEIEIESFSWGLSRSDQGAGGGGRAGRVSFSDFSFTIVMSKASPKLMTQCAEGTHIKNAQLTARRAGENQIEFLKVTLEDVLIASYQTGGSGSSLPMESLTLDFATAKIDFTSQEPTGKPGETVSAFIKLRR